MSNYITLKIDLSSIYSATPPVQDAEVKSTLIANDLIKEIIKQFGDETTAKVENYRLIRAKDEKVLGGRQSLQLQGITNRETLIFTSVTEVRIKNLGQSNSAYILAPSSGEQFQIKWYPAVIGRPDYKDSAQNKLLAVNLEGYENGQKVSRQHAQIKERKGQHYIQALSDRNPTILNGKRLELRKNYRLEDQDEIRLGFSNLELKFFID